MMMGKHGQGKHGHYTGGENVPKNNHDLFTKNSV